MYKTKLFKFPYGIGKFTSGLAVKNTCVVLVCFKCLILFHSNAFLSPESNLGSVLSYCTQKTALCLKVVVMTEIFINSSFIMRNLSLFHQ